MQNNVIDLILYLVRRMRIGDKINEVKLDGLHGYDNAEISAAWSWVLQKYHSGELKDPENENREGNGKSHRILHFAEKMMLTRDAYGYLLELHDMGLISSMMMEKIIEQAMLNSIEKVSLDKVKEMVVKLIFTSEDTARNKTMFLKGNESIN